MFNQYEFNKLNDLFKKYINVGLKIDNENWYDNVNQFLSINNLNIIKSEYCYEYGKMFLIKKLDNNKYKFMSFDCDDGSFLNNVITNDFNKICELLWNTLYCDLECFEINKI